MYLDFYGLEREPFHITPDPDFLYLSPSHKEAFATIVYGVEQRKGFVALTGEVGTGKTTVLRAYLKRIDSSKIRAIYLFNPDLTFEDLLYLLQRELQVEHHEAHHVPTMVEQIQLALLRDYEDKRNVALIIDEAQNMPTETLEKMRMLSNLETTHDKLLQIVLVGQPELDDKLNLHELRQLKQRIAVRAHIRKLSAAECESYIQHRLMHAGCIREQVFSPAAMKQIVKHADGTPRALNIICDNALIAGYGGGEEQVSVATVNAVICDLNRTSGKSAARSASRRLAWMAAAACVAVASGAFLLANERVNSGNVEAAEAPVVANAAPAVAAVAAVAEASQDAEATATAAPALEELPAPDTRQIALRRMAKLNEEISAMAGDSAIAVAGALAEMNSSDTPATAPAANEAAAAQSESPAEAGKPTADASVTAVSPDVTGAPNKPISETPAAVVPEAPVKVAEASAAPRIVEVPKQAEPPVEETPAPGHEPEAEPVSAPEPVAPPVAANEPVVAESAAPVDAAETNASGSQGPALTSLIETSADGEYIRRRVEVGEQLLRIISSVYGFHNRDLIEAVRQLNPQITNVDFIRAGDSLLLPAPERVKEGRVDTPATDGSGT